MREYDKLKDDAKFVEKHLPCNCDLDKWEPTRSTGHSHVCRVHKIVVNKVIDYGALARRWNTTIEDAKERVALIRRMLLLRREAEWEYEQQRREEECDEQV